MFLPPASVSCLSFVLIEQRAIKELHTSSLIVETDDIIIVTEGVQVPLLSLRISAPCLSPVCECWARSGVYLCKLRDTTTMLSQPSSQGQEILSQTKPIQSQEK